MKNTISISPYAPLSVIRTLSFFALILLGMTTNSAFAADVTITPTRVIFEGRDKSATVTLVNTSDQPKMFRITLANKKMTPEGNYIDVGHGEPNGRYADNMIRYSPRQIVLPPGKPQIVRLMLRKPRQLEDGDYTTYMKFTALPSDNDQTLESIVKKGETEMAIKLTPVVSVSIPVVVRQGKSDNTLSIDDLRLENTDKGKKVSLRLTREGNRTAYGDITAYLKTPNSSEEKIVGKAMGITILPPLTNRLYSLPLAFPEGSNSKGELRVVYRERESHATAPESGRRSDIQSSIPIQ